MPPALSDQYHRARRQFALFSALFLMWSLVGVRVNKKPLPQVDVELLNPEVVPFLLAVLVIYFWYRTSIEWFQCDIRRRRAVASRVDIIVANTLGAISLAVPVVQWLLQAQLADLWGQLPMDVRFLTVGSLGVIAFILSSLRIHLRPSPRPKSVNDRLALFLAFMAVALPPPILIRLSREGLLLIHSAALVTILEILALGYWYWLASHRMGLALGKALLWSSPLGAFREAVASQDDAKEGS